MTTTASRMRLYAPLVVAALMLAAPLPRASASDWGKVLGALAAGYVAYEILDDLSERGLDRYCPVDPNPRYDPPPRYYHGGEPRYFYNEGYRDGFKDGTAYGYRQGFGDGYQVGFQDGDRHGFQRGVRTGYRWGYADGYDDGHWDGFIEGVHTPRRWR